MQQLDIRAFQRLSLPLQYQQQQHQQQQQQQQHQHQQHQQQRPSLGISQVAGPASSSFLQGHELLFDSSFF